MKPQPFVLPIGQPFAKGGEGWLWKDVNDELYLVKVYFNREGKPQPKTAQDASALVALIEAAQELRPSDWYTLSLRSCWPTNVFGTSDHSISAIQIPLAPKNFMLQIKRHTDEQMQTELSRLVFLISDYFQRPIVEIAPTLSITLADRVELILEYLKVFSKIWEMGFCYGDYSGNNMAWALTPRPSVFVLDTDSAHRPGILGPFTIGWEMSDVIGLGIEKDRAKFALVAWRILAQDQNSRPGPNLIGSLNEVDFTTIRIITGLYETGTSDLVESLESDLQRYRSERNKNLAFDAAVGSQFARLVIEAAPSSPSTDQQLEIEAAYRQLKKESELSALAPKRRATRMMTMQSEPGYVWDLLDVITPISKIGDLETLLRFAYEAEFARVGALFEKGDVTLPMNGALVRVVQHALVELGRVKPETADLDKNLGIVRLKFSWPGAPFVNRAVIRLREPGGVIQEELVVNRRQNTASIDIPMGSKINQGTELTISYAVEAPDGTFIEGPVAGVVKLPEWRSSRILSPRTLSTPTLIELDRMQTVRNGSVPQPVRAPSETARITEENLATQRTPTYGAPQKPSGPGLGAFLSRLFRRKH